MRALKIHNKSYYETLDKPYRQHGHLMFRKMTLVLEHVPKGKYLLDVGCGTGELIDRVRNRFESIVGIDINPEAFEFSRKRFYKDSKINIYHLDVSEMPSWSYRFDVVTALDILEHLEDPEVVLTKIRHSLRKRGMLITTTPNWYDKIWSRMIKDTSHKTKYTSIGWQRLITKFGFRPVLVRTVDFPLFHKDFLCRYLHLFGICVMIKAIAE